MKIMKKFLTTIMAGAMMLAACDKAPKFQVEGTIEGAKDSMLYFSQNTLEGVQKLDSVKLKEDGSFSFKATAPTESPEFYTLQIGRHVINFSVDSTETMTITAKLATMEKDYTIEGNESSKRIKEISKMQQEMQTRLIAFEKNVDMLPGDQRDSIESVVNTYKEHMKNEFIFPDPESAAAYYAVCQSITDLGGSFMLFNPLTDRDDVRCYAMVANAWDNAYHDAPRTQQLCNMAIKGMDNTAAPQQKVLDVDESKVTETGIIDINLPDINGKLRSIKDLKGKATSPSMAQKSPPNARACYVPSTSNTTHKVSKSTRFHSTRTFTSGSSLARTFHGYVCTKQTVAPAAFTTSPTSPPSSSSIATTKLLSAATSWRVRWKIIS